MNIEGGEEKRGGGGGGDVKEGGWVGDKGKRRNRARNYTTKRLQIE